MMQKKNSDKKKEKVEELARQVYKIYAEQFTVDTTPFYRIDSRLQDFYRTVAEFILANYTRKY